MKWHKLKSLLYNLILIYKFYLNILLTDYFVSDIIYKIKIIKRHYINVMPFNLNLIILYKNKNRKG